MTAVIFEVDLKGRCGERTEPKFRVLTLAVGATRRPRQARAPALRRNVVMSGLHRKLRLSMVDGMAGIWSTKLTMFTKLIKPLSVF